jgi:hypothetical protein
MIHGAGGNAAPAAIVLYQYRSPGAPPAQAAAHADEPALAEGGVDG